MAFTTDEVIHYVYSLQWSSKRSRGGEYQVWPSQCQLYPWGGEWTQYIQGQGVWLSLVGAATSIIFVVTKVLCFVIKLCLLWQNIFVATNLLRQAFFYCDKRLVLSWQKLYLWQLLPMIVVKCQSLWQCWSQTLEGRREKPWGVVMPPFTWHPAAAREQPAFRTRMSWPVLHSACHHLNTQTQQTSSSLNLSSPQHTNTTTSSSLNLSSPQHTNQFFTQLVITSTHKHNNQFFTQLVITNQLFTQLVITSTHKPVLHSACHHLNTQTQLVLPSACHHLNTQTFILLNKSPTMMCLA